MTTSSPVIADPPSVCPPTLMARCGCVLQDLGAAALFRFIPCADHADEHDSKCRHDGYPIPLAGECSCLECVARWNLGACTLWAAALLLPEFESME